MLLAAGSFALAEEAPLVSPAQLQKILKFVDTIGAKDRFPAPMAQNLGLSNDFSLDLPVTSIKTDDHSVYFCRSELDPADYIVWVRTKDNTASYMFATRADFKLKRALYLRTSEFPQTVDINSSQVLSIYKNALLTLTKDVDSSSPPRN